MDHSAPFVPLSRALHIIAGQTPGTRCHTQALAGTVSALVTLYALTGGSARPLREAELHGAVFVDGGDSVSFVDGRPPIGDLAVASDAVERVARVLQGATLQLES